MALKKHPFYEGQITVVAGENDSILIFEEDLLNPLATLSFNEKVTPGTYWVTELMSVAANAINGATGLQNTYGFTLDRDTGKVTVSVTAGSAAWKIITDPDYACLLTGWDYDTFLRQYGYGQQGRRGLGFGFEPRVFIGPTGSFTGEYQSSGVWCPSWPPANDGEDALVQTVIEAVQIDGRSNIYSFNEPLWDSRIDGHLGGYFGGYFATRTQQYQLIPLDEMNHWYFYFWPEYAFDGSVIAYFEAWDDLFPRAYTLTDESLRANILGARPHGIQLFDFAVKMRPTSRPGVWGEIYATEF